MGMALSASILKKGLQIIPGQYLYRDSYQHVVCCASLTVLKGETVTNQGKPGE